MKTHKKHRGAGSSDYSLQVTCNPYYDKEYKLINKQTEIDPNIYSIFHYRVMIPATAKVSSIEFVMILMAQNQPYIKFIKPGGIFPKYDKDKAKVRYPKTNIFNPSEFQSGNKETFLENLDFYFLSTNKALEAFKSGLPEIIVKRNSNAFDKEFSEGMGSAATDKHNEKIANNKKQYLANPRKFNALDEDVQKQIFKEAYDFASKAKSDWETRLLDYKSANPDPTISIHSDPSEIVDDDPVIESFDHLEDIQPSPKNKKPFLKAMFDELQLCKIQGVKDRNVWYKIPKTTS